MKKTMITVAAAFTVMGMASPPASNTMIESRRNTPINT
jgi:hypothetical protein